MVEYNREEWIWEDAEAMFWRVLESSPPYDMLWDACVHLASQRWDTRETARAAEKAFMAAKAALEHERDCRREAESQLYRAVEVFTQQRAKQ